MVRILLADPDPTTREALSALAQRRSFELLSSTDGIRALRMALEESLDLVIVEQQLPHRSGLDMLADLRKRRPELPVAVLSAFGSVEDAVAAMRIGPSD